MAPQRCRYDAPFGGDVKGSSTTAPRTVMSYIAADRDGRHVARQADPAGFERATTPGDRAGRGALLRRPRDEHPPQRGRRGPASVVSAAPSAGAVAMRVARPHTPKSDEPTRTRTARRHASTGKTPSPTLKAILSELMVDRQVKVRRGSGSPQTLRYYQRNAGWLLAFFGPACRLYPWERDPDAVSWEYIRWRRSSASDRTIATELSTLRVALYIALQRGQFAGNPARAFPASFAPRRRRPRPSFSREQFLNLVSFLPEEAAAVAAFILATSAEWGAVVRAQTADLPSRISLQKSVHMRGGATGARPRKVPLVTREQVTLLSFARKHARGKTGQLFSRGTNYFREYIARGCFDAGLEGVSASGLRYTSGLWLLEQLVPLETVSRIMGHSSSTLTKQVYAETRDRPVRTNASLFRMPASQVDRAIRHIPKPKKRKRYSVAGVEKSLAEWARESGIPKETLFARLKRGLTMGEALHDPRARR
jgi:integrase